MHTIQIEAAEAARNITAYKAQLHQLERRFPEARKDLELLDELVYRCFYDVEMKGVRRHGEQILQAIAGDRYQHDGCAPHDVRTAFDDEWERAHNEARAGSFAS